MKPTDPISRKKISKIWASQRNLLRCSQWGLQPRRGGTYMVSWRSAFDKKEEEGGRKKKISVPVFSCKRGHWDTGCFGERSAVVWSLGDKNTLKLQDGEWISEYLSVWSHTAPQGSGRKCHYTFIPVFFYWKKAASSSALWPPLSSFLSPLSPVSSLRESNDVTHCSEGEKTSERWLQVHGRHAATSWFPACSWSPGCVTPVQFREAEAIISGTFGPPLRSAARQPAAPALPH